MNGFNLVGGTALALYLGHRKSVDIYLFSNFSFNASQVIELIQQDYSMHLYSTGPNTIKGRIDNVNVDIIAHRFPYLNEPSVIDGIKILSIPDLIAMKLNAISLSGQRSKDFVDIYFLLEGKRFIMDDMVKFYQTKYNQHGEMHVIKSLIYFNDVDLSDWPVLLKKPLLKWSDVKKKIEKEALGLMKG
ncbi:MAG TPA: nucleotidyl transferase AbiEii/AbiGii toxin family protein [Desulfatiglandales bacterium]|nr:nucleotidyl transferase AbiEii/AbiGii toxin family protein [Desulfatiglandales bacterium]